MERPSRTTGRNCGGGGSASVKCLGAVADTGHRTRRDNPYICAPLWCLKEAVQNPKGSEVFLVQRLCPAALATAAGLRLSLQTPHQEDFVYCLPAHPPFGRRAVGGWVQTGSPLPSPKDYGYTSVGSTCPHKIRRRFVLHIWVGLAPSCVQKWHLRNLV